MAPTVALQTIAPTADMTKATATMVSATMAATTVVTMGATTTGALTATERVAWTETQDVRDRAVLPVSLPTVQVLQE